MKSNKQYGTRCGFVTFDVQRELYNISRSESIDSTNLGTFRFRIPKGSVVKNDLTYLCCKLIESNIGTFIQYKTSCTLCKKYMSCADCVEVYTDNHGYHYRVVFSPHNIRLES